jgi:hypothetical protein
MLPQGRLLVTRWSFPAGLLVPKEKPAAVWVTLDRKLASRQMMQMREVRVRLKPFSPVPLLSVFLCRYLYGEFREPA